MAKFRKPAVTWYHCAQHGEQTPRIIVLHDTESHDAKGLRDVGAIFDFWRRQGLGYGAHFVIDAAGNIGQGAPLAQKTYAVEGHNTGCVHIELVGYAWWNLAKWRRRKAQLEKCKKLVAWISRQYSIRLVHSTDKGLCMHRDFHGSHTDPGPNFPFHDVLTGARFWRKTGW